MGNIPMPSGQVVPQVEKPAHIENGVYVQKSTNYDLSRTLIETPVKEELSKGSNVVNGPANRQAYDSTKPPIVFTKSFTVKNHVLDANSYEVQKQLDMLQNHPGYTLSYSTSAEAKSPANLAVFEFLQKVMQIMGAKNKVVYDVKNTGFGNQFRIDEKNPVTINLTFEGYAYEPFSVK